MIDVTKLKDHRISTKSYTRKAQYCSTTFKQSFGLKMFVPCGEYRQYHPYHTQDKANKPASVVGMSLIHAKLYHSVTCGRHSEYTLVEAVRAS